MSDVLCERHGPVTLITINAPHKMNALDYEANQQIVDFFREFRDDKSARVAVLTGAGDKAFCSGADLKTFSLPYATQPAPVFRSMFVNGMGFGGITRGLRVNKPIIAAINGYAMSGGFELALAADVRFCSPNAIFAIQDVIWGMHPCDGGSVRLPKIVGLGRAMEIILSGERFDAEHALRIGLVNRIVAQQDLLAQSLRYAELLASRSPLAQQFVKDVEYRAPGLSLEEAIRMELRSFSDLAHSEDLTEGVAAFKQRRPARFKGH